MNVKSYENFIKSSKESIEAWLNLSTDNRQILDEIVNTWQLTKNKPGFYEPSLDILWTKLLERIVRKPAPPLSVKPNFRWIAAAAIITIVFLSGIWIGTSKIDQKDTTSYVQVISEPGTRTKMNLPDNTTVWLNSGAEIRYPSSFKKNTRDVFMSGECYFDVT